jgi:hypothetical protein
VYAKFCRLIPSVDYHTNLLIYGDKQKKLKHNLPGTGKINLKQQELLNLFEESVSFVHIIGSINVYYSVNSIANFDIYK